MVPEVPELTAGVWVDGSAEVAGGLERFCFVGPQATIETGAVVKDSVVGSSCRVGPGVVLRNCVLMADAEIGPGAVLRDTIVGPRAVIGEGARLGGMTIIGVGAEVPPGVVLDGARFPVS